MAGTAGHVGCNAQHLPGIVSASSEAAAGPCVSATASAALWHFPALDCLWLLLLNLEWAGTWAAVFEDLTTCSEIHGQVVRAAAPQDQSLQ